MASSPAATIDRLYKKYRVSLALDLFLPELAPKQHALTIRMARRPLQRPQMTAASISAAVAYKQLARLAKQKVGVLLGKNVVLPHRAN